MLAACLIHASRTGVYRQYAAKGNFSCMMLVDFSGERVSNAWTTCLKEGNNPEKSGLMSHKTTDTHVSVVKNCDVESWRFKKDPCPIS